MKLAVICILLSMVILSACGIKPEKLSPPNKHDNTYQKTYPDISTDPK